MRQPRCRTLMPPRVVALTLIGLAAISVALAEAPARAAGVERWQPQRDPAPRPELQHVLDQLVAAGAPGAAAIVNDGSRPGQRPRVWTGASGVADLRSGRPMRPGDGFRVGSLTKTFVATVVLQLVDERRLSLSDSVARWLPGILPYGDRITVRQLLNHTSGIPEEAFIPMLQLYQGVRFRSWTPRELVALIADQPQVFPAGTQWAYTNTNYLLAGLIVEAVTRNSLEAELVRRIFRPLQLRNTYFPVNLPFLAEPHASGYSLALDDSLTPIEGPLIDFTLYNPSSLWAEGNVVSTERDLARFFHALLGGRLLSGALLSDMKRPVAVSEPGFGYGLGLYVVDTPCGTVFGHTGGVPGFANWLFNSGDGSRQAGVMINAEAPPAAAGEAFTTLAVEQGLREAFSGQPCAAGSPGRSEIAVNLNGG